MTFRTRFAPSPTGPLHLGHAFSALLAFEMAQSAGGTFLLRIEDIDASRSRAAWEAQIYDDLAWLGVSWPEPVMRQSDRHPTYHTALDALWARRLLYPCHCKRADIAAAVSAPQEGAPLLGPDGIVYPGTCRTKNNTGGVRPKDAVLRLDMAKAVANMPTIRFEETGYTPGWHGVDPEDIIRSVGDVVLVRRDMAASYHLCVVVDDAAQEISHVVRGQDLFEATQIHVVLQHLLGLPTPVYHHHSLIRDAAGKRLAKRDDARAISTYRSAGFTPRDFKALLNS